MKIIKILIAIVFAGALLAYGLHHLRTNPHDVALYMISTPESPVLLESFRVNGQELLVEPILITGRGSEGELGGIAARMKPERGVVREGTLVLRIGWVDLVTKNAFVGHMTIPGNTLHPKSILDRTADVRLAFVTGGWLVQTPPFSPIPNNPFESALTRICGEPTLESNVSVNTHLRNHPDLLARISSLQAGLSGRPSCRNGA